MKIEESDVVIGCTCKCSRISEDERVATAEKKDPLQSIEYQTLFTELSFNAGLETDRQLLTLSSAGLGILLALAGAKSDFFNPGGLTFVLFLASSFFFLFTIIVLVKTLDENKMHIVRISRGESDSDSEILKRLEALAKFGFYSAISCTILIFIMILSGGDFKWQITKTTQMDVGHIPILEKA